MDQGYIWIEIVEPKSNKKMYANMETGETTWRPPAEVKYKRSNDNQWWELFDKKTHKHYYFNATLNKTVWKKPHNADIVPLTKLQAEQEVKFSSRSPVTVRSMDIDSSGARSHLRKAPSAPLRPLTELNLPHNGGVTRQEISEISESVDNGSGIVEVNMSRDKRSQSESADPSWTNQNNPLYVNLEHTSLPAVIHTDVKMRQTTERNDLIGPPKKYEHFRDSFDDIDVDDIPSHTDRNLDRYSRTLDPKTMGTNRDLYGDSQESGSAHCLTTQDLSLNTVLADPIKKPLAKSSSITFPPHEFPRIDDTKRISSASLNPSGMSRGILVRPRQYGETVMRLETFKELNQHKQGFIIRKKVSIADMLSWTKDPIKQPMIRTSNKSKRKEAIELFKLVQHYMGDKRSFGRAERDNTLLEIARRGWTNYDLRDELYIQLCRQTTSNDKTESLRRGWEVFSVCLAFFPPSRMFANYLEGYLWQKVEPEADRLGVEVSAYGKYCYKTLEKIRLKGAKKGLKMPTLEEVTHARQAPFNPSVFGVSLEEIMELQKDTYPELKIPWIQKSLFEYVIRLSGHLTEGIFRVPGDIDEVNTLRMRYDRSEEPNDITDPHTPSSLLKLWFRELENPLIPDEFYEECINNSHNEQQCIALAESLPKLNRTVFFSLIRFLQYFSVDESQRYTKMSPDNMAMVWAPNCLRCPSEDTMEILENTRKEMSFLRHLIHALDTSSVQDII